LLFKHTARVRSVAFSPDGSLLASGGEDRKVCVKDLAGDVRPIRFNLPNIVNNVTFSNDGKTLAAVCNFPDGALRLWDVGKWVEVILPGHSSHVGGLAASPAGPLWVTGSEDGTIRFWDRTAKGLPPYSIGPGMFGGEVLPAFSPMSRYLVTG